MNPTSPEKASKNAKCDKKQNKKKKRAGESSYQICSYTGCQKRTQKGLNPCVVHRACVCVFWNVNFCFEPFDVIMSFPLCLPICFSSSLCFSVMSTLFLLNKGKHAIPHNGIFSSVVCPWMGLFAFAGKSEYSSLCVRVCVFVCEGWGTAGG